MLVGDRSKDLALVFGFAFATLLMAQQSAFCVGLVSLAGNAVLDVRKGSKTIESTLPMPDSELHRVRGVSGESQAIPMFRGAAAVRMPDGSSEAVAVVGVDDTTLMSNRYIIRRMAFGLFTSSSQTSNFQLPRLTSNSGQLSLDRSAESPEG
jgi:putative ABC transport system permease protein